MSGPVGIERRGLWQEERLEENLHRGRQPGPAALVRGLGGACPLGIGGRRHKIWRDIFGDGGDAGGIGHGVDDLDDNNCPRPRCPGVLLGCQCVKFPMPRAVHDGLAEQAPVIVVTEAISGAKRDWHC
jgi:hypothetical protein